jgi:hypothetical protein
MAKEKANRMLRRKKTPEREEKRKERTCSYPPEVPRRRTC